MTPPDPATTSLLAATSFAAATGVATTAPRVLASREPVAAWTAVLASAVLAALADGAPTGVAEVDTTWRMLFGAVVAAAGARSGRWPLATGATLVAAVGLLGDSWLGVPVAAGAIGFAAMRIRGRILGAVLGAGVAQAALRTGLDEPRIAAPLVAGLALALLGVSAVRRARRRDRRRMALAAGGAAAFLAVPVLLYVAGAALAYPDVRAGVRAAEVAVGAARQGDQDGAVEALELAAAHFRSAHRGLDRPWMAPALLVPGLSDNARALRELAAEGATLARAGVEAGRAVSIDGLRLRNSALDVSAFIELRAPFTSVISAATDARSSLAGLRRTWLAGPVAERLDSLMARVDDAVHDADVGLAASELGPRLLGGEGPRRWLIALQTPAELRASGGIVGSFAEVVVDQGRLELDLVGRSADFNHPAAEVGLALTGPDDYVARYERFTPQLVLQNVTMSPDFPSVGEVLVALWPQATGRRIDGVISMDPIAMAAFLRLTGPVQVDDWPEPIGHENAADVLLRQQYLRLGDEFEGADRVDFLEAVTRAVFRRLEDAELPGPRQLANVLAPMVREGRLKLYSPDLAEQALFERIGADGALAPTAGDELLLVTQNASGNKIDLFLERSLRYEATIDPGTGTVTATATVTLRNGAPAEGLPGLVIHGSGSSPTAPGENRLYLSLYSPLGLTGATLDGAPLPMESAVELGRNVYSTFVTIPPGRSVVLELAISGEVDLRGGGYRLHVGHQPTIEPDDVAVTLSLPDGWRFDAADGLEAAGDRARGAWAHDTDRTLGVGIAHR